MDDALNRGISAAILVSVASLVASNTPFAGFGLVRRGFGLEGPVAVRGFFAGGGSFDLRGCAAGFFGENSCSSSRSVSRSEGSVRESLSSLSCRLRLLGD